MNSLLIIFHMNILFLYNKLIIYIILKLIINFKDEFRYVKDITI